MKKLFNTFFILGFVGVFCVACNQHNKKSDLIFSLSKDGTYYSVRAKDEVLFKETVEIIIPEEYKGLPVKKIENFGFANRKMGAVKLSNNIEEIGEYAFSHDINLKKVEFGKKLKIIGSNAFECCFNLDGNICFPESLESINKQSFYLCENVNSYYLDRNVSYIGESTFVTGSAHFSINVSEENKNYKVIDGTLFTKDEKTLILYNHNREELDYSIPNTVETVSENAFSYSNIQFVNIPDSVIKLGASVFQWCTNLNKVTFSKNLNEISEYAFVGCQKLNNIDIPGNISIIREGAFMGCRGLLNIRLNDGLKIIEEYALHDAKLSEIPASVEIIENYAFAWSLSSKVVNIPTSLTRLGYNFMDSHILEINVVNGNENYHSKNGMLYNTFNNELMICPRGKKGEIEVENGTEYIYTNAFHDCSYITSISIPNSIRTISIDAFELCYNLEQIYYAGSIREWVDSFNNFYGGIIRIHCSDGEIIHPMTERPPIPGECG